MQETWRKIPSFPYYEASDCGRIRSVDRHVSIIFRNRRVTQRFLRGKVLSPGKSGSGYLGVVLSGTHKLIHHLVAMTFIGPRPPGMLVLHCDGDPMNNSATNLRYGTYLENIADAVTHGTFVCGSSSSAAKLYEQQASCILALRGTWTAEQTAKAFGVSKGTIRRIYNRSSWKNAPEITREEALSWFYSKMDLTLT